MAISQVGFGLKPINKVGSNYNAAQVSEYVSIRKPGYGIAFQAPITIGSTGLRRVQRAVYTNVGVDGSFVGIQYDDASGKPVFTDHYTREDLERFNFNNDGTKTFTQFVTDDPYQLYLMKTDADITLSQVNGNYNFDNSTRISSDGKRSEMKLNMSTKNFTSNRQFQFITLGNSVDDVQLSDIGTNSNFRNSRLDAGSNLVVRLNASKYLQRSNARLNSF